MVLRKERYKVEGLIARYDLQDWWFSSFAEEERRYIDERFQPMGMPPHTLTHGDRSSSQPATEFLNDLASWFRSQEDAAIAERIYGEIRQLAHKQPISGPGYFNGRHFTTYVHDVESLKREGKLDEATDLLLELVAATEAEDKIQKLGVAPSYYEELAKIYRKQKDYPSEVEILRRFSKQRHAPGAKPPKLMARLEQASAIMVKNQEKQQPPTKGTKLE